MTSITFDTLKFVRTLQTANFSEEQAEALSAAIKDVQQESNLATKADLRELENRIVYRLTLQMGGMFIANIMLLTALYKLFVS
uniref:DUF1640 domain-containing protein n=2 Tax=unclassified Candidatus Kentrum TaxID=2643149 RepID=A0A451APT1_9GAMM|nr:MAG: Protein of unknown function (DUF1640) [Candidatus Kentron sp. LPFa]VFK68037.1 MAG: Protein of unknown function (DUF1640) [Candidatus Kentron sp. UNK]VFK71911.1 MAG: Protein of unknown function (DUF1640) [Candidatus Kentron sp. UNK]